MLVLTGLTKDFGGFRAVDHCSCSVAEGSITGLIGPNGAGKTTLFNLVAGALWPDDGRVEFLGEDISLLPRLEDERFLGRECVAGDDGRLTWLEIGRASCRERVCQYV